MCSRILGCVEIGLDGFSFVLYVNSRHSRACFHFEFRISIWNILAVLPKLKKLNLTLKKSAKAANPLQPHSAGQT